jgi:hypothetical protein
MSKRILLWALLPLGLVICLGGLLVYYMYSTSDIGNQGITVSTPESQGQAARGQNIALDQGGNHIEAQLEPAKSYNYLFKDEGVSINSYAGDGFVMVIPQEVADPLKAKFGDFFRCNDPGAAEAIRNSQAIILVASNAPIRQKVDEAMGLVRQSRIPLVKFNGARLKVSKRTYLNMEVHDNVGTPIYYLTDFSIIRPDYLK